MTTAAAALAMVLAASDPGLEAAWNECLREARAPPQLLECNAAFSGHLAGPAEPDTEHGRLVRAILNVRQRLADQALAEELRRAEARQAALERAAAAQAEKERREAAERETRAATEHLLAARQENPRFMQLAWSSVICRWTSIRTDAKREIEKERKYAREGGGVVDLGALHAEQQRMRRADEHSEHARSELRNWKAKPLPCKETLVFAAVVCLAADEEHVELDEDLRATCHSLDMTLLLKTIHRADSYL